MEQVIGIAEGANYVRNECQHDFRFDGVRFNEVTGNDLPKAGHRKYFDIYVCKLCGMYTSVLLDQDETLESAIRYDALPFESRG